MLERVTAPERDLIERMLAFANLPAVTSTRQVEDIFDGATLLGGVEIQRLRSSEVGLFREHHRALREHLEAIASGKTAERVRIADAVSRSLDTAQLRLVLHQGRLIIAYRVAGVAGCCHLALAFVLEDARGITNRLGQCKTPGGCGKFNLTFEGKARFYCDDAHRRAHDDAVAAERLRDYRERKRREKQRAAKKRKEH